MPHSPPLKTIPLPPELLLLIIPHIPFTSTTLLNLHLTCRALHTFLTIHERTLSLSIRSLQFSHTAARRFFPGLPPFPSSPSSSPPSCSAPTSFASLSTLSTRLLTLTAAHETWLHIISHGPELAWLRQRWDAVHLAGLLLLYRLHDARQTPPPPPPPPPQSTTTSPDFLPDDDSEGEALAAHHRQAALIASLPAPSLACLLFKLVAATKILRVHGAAPVNARCGAEDVGGRAEVELALEEVLLREGPGVLGALLEEGKRAGKGEGEAKGEEEVVGWATRSLRKEIDGMDERQAPNADGTHKPATLTSCLRRAFAARVGCHFSENVAKMWEMLGSSRFEKMDDGMVAMIVQGEYV